MEKTDFELFWDTTGDKTNWRWRGEKTQRNMFPSLVLKFLKTVNYIIGFLMLIHCIDIYTRFCSLDSSIAVTKPT